ncbi:hypothetical protein BJ742DRAFT_790521 [Cladochytrium replicatum]|nr:hypothetical protein BJ742DRAFT_790521 [Cladochytrium replicatum]
MSHHRRLAPELLLQIFGYLENAAQLCAVSKVNRLWHRFSNADHLWLDLCLKAGIEVPLDPATLARHVALVSVAAQQSLVTSADTFVDMSTLPFDEEVLWVLCRKTLEAAGKSFPFDRNGQPDTFENIASPSRRSHPGNKLRSPSVDSRWSELTHTNSESSRRGTLSSRLHQAPKPGVHSWKLMQLPLFLRFAPKDIDVILPPGMPLPRVLYSAYATLYRGFWNEYPQVKHLSRRLEKWLSMQLPSSFQSLARSGMGWRHPLGACPRLKKRPLHVRQTTFPQSASMEIERTVVRQPHCSHTPTGITNAQHELVTAHNGPSSKVSSDYESTVANYADFMDTKPTESFQGQRYSSLHPEGQHGIPAVPEDRIVTAQNLTARSNPFSETWSGFELQFGIPVTTAQTRRVGIPTLANHLTWENVGDEVDMDTDESSGSEALTHVEDEMEDISLSPGSNSLLTRGGVEAITRADSGPHRRNELNQIDEDIWTFGNLQFIPRKASRSLKELALFYHLFRDGERPIMGSPPFGLFGSYLCSDLFVSLEMRPSRQLCVEKVLDLDVVNFATCRRTGKSLFLVISCSEVQSSNMLWRVVHMDESSRKYQDYGTFGQFLEKYVTDIERGLHSIGAQSQNWSVENRNRQLEWFELISLGSKLERAIKQRKLILSTKARDMDETTIQLRQSECKHLQQLLWRLPPAMPVPFHPSPTLPPNAISMFSSFSTMSFRNGVEMRLATLDSLDVSEANQKLFRVRFKYSYDSYDEHGEPMIASDPLADKAFNDILSEYEGGVDSPLIDVHLLDTAVMTSNNGLIDKTTDHYPFPASHQPYMFEMPAYVAGLLGIDVTGQRGPSVSLPTTWDLMLLIINMFRSLPSGSVKIEPCQLVSRQWSLKFRSGATRVDRAEGLSGQFPRLSVESSFFEYCSYVPDQESDPCVSIEGKFTFVPGSLEAPTGPRFDVPIARTFFPTSLVYDESSRLVPSR